VVSGHGAGFVDFALIPHFEAEGHEDATLANAEIWAAQIPAPTYAIDDASAIKVVDGDVQVVSVGWGKGTDATTPVWARFLILRDELSLRVEQTGH